MRALKIKDHPKSGGNELDEGWLLKIKDHPKSGGNELDEGSQDQRPPKKRGE